MEQWVYLKCTTMPDDLAYIVRKKGVVIEDWNSKRKKWNKNDDALAAFIGIDDDHYEDISEKEANEIIAKYN